VISRGGPATAPETPVHFRGSWTLSSFVALRYRGRWRPCLDPALSLAELGQSGTAPGLQLQDSSTSEVSLMGGATLWRAKSLHASPETK
jgi:hypothetical protein